MKSSETVTYVCHSHTDHTQSVRPAQQLHQRSVGDVDLQQHDHQGQCCPDVHVAAE